MQKIYLEKVIDLHHQLKELVALSVDESINYKIENEGIRAVGNLIIKGEYKNVEKQTFEETLELDILATFDKILDQRDFSIKVEDFDYAIKDGNIKVSIEAGVHGVISGEDRYVKEDPLDQIETLMRDAEESIEFVEPIMEATASREAMVEEPVVEMEKPVVETVKEVREDPIQTQVIEPVIAKAVSDIKPVIKAREESSLEDKEIEQVANTIDDQLQEVVYQSKSRPIFQDTEDSVGTYYLYIVKDNDTYASIGERYTVDEYVLKEYNQNRELEIGGVLIVPYVP